LALESAAKADRWENPETAFHPQLPSRFGCRRGRTRPEADTILDMITKEPIDKTPPTPPRRRRSSRRLVAFLLLALALSIASLVAWQVAVLMD